MNVSEIALQSPVILTEGAVQEVINLMSQLNVPQGHGLRLGVKGGGCSGYSYILGFDAPLAGDNVYEINGFILMIDKAQELYLHGTELDFKQGLDNRGFVFNNPNAASTCGCGSSFSA